MRTYIDTKAFGSRTDNDCLANGYNGYSRIRDARHAEANFLNGSACITHARNDLLRSFVRDSFYT